MKKVNREILFNKYEGKCAYCGCKLEKGWHADHIEPIKRNSKVSQDKIGLEYCENPEKDNLNNLNPSCRSCNINKHSMSLESFRVSIKKYVESLNKYSVQYKMAKKYGLINENDIEIKFYFEK